MQISRIIGHRGASAYTPENTMASFERAHALGAQWVEFDVMLNGDGEAFIFHDDSLKRTTNGRGEFGHASSEYIRSLDAGRWFSRRFKGEKIPTFTEVLHWLIAHQMKANIEIKPYPGQIEATTMAVLSALNACWPREESLPLISSFEREALVLCRSIMPDLPLGLLMHEWQQDWLKFAQDLHCVSVHVNRKILTKTRIAEIKQHGFILCAYTVNSKRLARKFWNLGVDAVFSDYPDLVS